MNYDGLECLAFIKGEDRVVSFVHGASSYYVKYNSADPSKPWTVGQISEVSQPVITADLISISDNFNWSISVGIVGYEPIQITVRDGIADPPIPNTPE